MATSSPRTLGKGRVIGARPQPSQPSPLSHSSTPPKQIASSPSQDTLKAPNQPFQSPSESSLSLNSQQSTSRSSNDEQDISAALARQTKERESNGGGVGAQAQLICPICNEQMMTLLQLNRHLDDAHKGIQEEEQDEIQDWFKTQVIKAKKFQPLALLNQKFKGLDVFDLNEERRSSSASPAPRSRQSSPQPIRPSALPETVQARVVDPDDVVTKDHWQRYTRDGTCSDPMCERRLGGMDGRINCRKCGKLFCEEHTMYQMKLSKSAQHEPIRGYWCRVCETCYKSREGYNDRAGAEEDITNDFKQVRRKAMDKAYLHVSRLEKRLTKLTQLLANARLDQDQGTVAYLRKASGQKSQRRLLEESVVDWQDDASITNCPFCHQEFTSYTFRRHHCRLCGRVVCADPATSCSTQESLDVDPAHAQHAASEKSGELVKVDVRMCQDCSTTLFSKADFAREVAQMPPDQRAFRTLKQFEHGIELMLPRFQRLLQVLQDPDDPPSHAQIGEATKVRKRLTDAFTQYDMAARRVRDAPSSSEMQARLQKQVYVQASQFLHTHMLPLKSLPKILKHAAPPSSGLHSRNSSTASVMTVNGRQSASPAPQLRSSPLTAIKNADTDGTGASSQASQSSRLSVLEDEEKTAREQLIVLEEQRFMVGEMLADAQRRRKFEEVESLGRNVEDLDTECGRLRGELEKVKTQVEEVWKYGER
ncbi:MAG: hypothetical protein Q9162_002305 [Coniocarpon cinnabarinum]